MKESERDALFAEMFGTEQRPTPQPSGMLKAFAETGTAGLDQPKLIRAKSVRRNVGTPATPEVLAALDKVRATYKRMAGQGVAKGFTTNAAILKAAVLAYADLFGRTD